MKRLQVGKRYSEAAIHQGVVYLAGQVPEQSRGADIAAQTAEVLALIDALLRDAGSDKHHLLMVTIYLADLADYAGMNTVWDAWVSAHAAPPRACVQAQLADRSVKLT